LYTERINSVISYCN